MDSELQPTAVGSAGDTVEGMLLQENSISPQAYCINGIGEVKRGLEECMRDCEHMRTSLRAMMAKFNSGQNTDRLKSLMEKTTRLEEKLQNPLNHINDLETEGVAVVEKDKFQDKMVDLETTGVTQRPDSELTKPLSKSKKQRLRRKRNREIARSLKLGQPYSTNENAIEDKICHVNLEGFEHRTNTESANLPRNSCIEAGEIKLAPDNDELCGKRATDKEAQERKQGNEEECAGYAGSTVSAITETLLESEPEKRLLMNIDNQEIAGVNETPEWSNGIKEATFIEEKSIENKVLSKSQKRRIRRRRKIEEIKERKLKKLARQMACIGDTEYKTINAQSIDNHQNAETDGVLNEDKAAEETGNIVKELCNKEKLQEDEIFKLLLKSQMETLKTIITIILVGLIAYTSLIMN